MIRKIKEYQRARELRLKGMTLRAIAQEVEVHWTTVQNWVRDLPIQHKLSEIDIEERTAMCAVCGSVAIRKNGDKWRCRNATQSAYEQTVRKSQQRFYTYLTEQKCADCPESDPIVLEFDHLSNDKEYAISDMVRKGYKWESILKEIQKCEVVCANCHRRRTNERGNWFRFTSKT